MDDPNFVRLTNRLTRGCLADVKGSGWSIAGLDVKPFPKDSEAAKFVRKNLGAGKLEPASRAEFEDIDEANKTIAKAMRDQYPDFDVTPQEGVVQKGVREAQKALFDKRADKRSAEERYDEDVRQPRRERAQGGPLPDNLDDLKRPELVALAEKRGLPKNGTRAELIARLVQNEEFGNDEGGDSEDE